MTLAADLVVSIAGGLVVEIVSFLLLQRFHSPPATNISVRGRSESLVIRNVRSQGPLLYDQSSGRVEISDSTFAVEDRTSLHLLLALLPAGICAGVLVSVLILL